MRSTLTTFGKHTIGRVHRRTSTKQRSITLGVRSLRHQCRGRAEKDSHSGKSRSSRRTTPPQSRRQRARKLGAGSLTGGAASCTWRILIVTSMMISVLARMAMWTGLAAFECRDCL